MSGSGNPFEVPTRATFQVEVTVEEGPSAGERFVLDRFPAFVGRGHDADVRLLDDPDDPKLSRRHARITVEAGRVAIADLSTNGTWVGERHLSHGEVVPLRGDEDVWLGPQTRIAVRPLGDARRPPVRASGASPGVAEAAPRSVPVPVGQAAAPTEARTGEEVVLEVGTLGPLRVRVGGRDIPDAAWPSRKAMVLLAFLADAAGRSVAADRVGDVLWPDAVEGARAVLQTTVSRVRKAFRSIDDGLPDPVMYDRTGYRMGGGYDVRCDAREFEALCGRGDAASLERAVGMYQGPFLEGHADDWVQSRRRVLETLYFDTVDALAAQWEVQGRLGDALRLYERVLEHEPCREQTQLGLLRTLVAAGRRDEALRRYHAFTRLLKKQLGLTPGPPLVALYLSLRGAEDA